jgi:PKD repeat protein
MKKKYLLIVSIAVLTSMFFLGCEKPVDPPQADFSVTEIYSAGDITFSFSDISSGNPDEWLWTFEGGTPYTSTLENPTVSYSEPGSYDVTLVVTNEGGEDVITGYNYINVVQFNNPLFTDMYVTVNGTTKTMAPDSYVQFGQINDYSVSYYAETYGETTGGTIIGEEIYWDETVNLTEYSSYNLILGYDFIFFYITNPYDAGDYNFNQFWVNYGDYYDETVDNITIPCDGITYGTGYYYTNYGMEVRAYYQDYPTFYEQWFVYPSTENNLYMNLTFNKSTKKKSEEVITSGSQKSETLYPASKIKNKIELDPNAKNLAPSNKKNKL